MTIWRMRIAYCIPRATNTHSEYVIFVDFPLQQWLHERTSVLRYTYCTLPILCVVWYSPPPDSEARKPNVWEQLLLRDFRFIFSQGNHLMQSSWANFFVLYSYVELKTHQCNTSHLWVYSRWTSSGSQFSFYKQTVSHVKSLRKVWTHVGEWSYTSIQSPPEERVPETR